MELIKKKRESGFTLLEMLVALAIFLVVSGIVMSGMIQMTKVQGTVANRTEMHTSVRSATELLQQEIGQAGRISLPVGVTPVITGPITASTNPQTVPISSTVNMFQYMLLDVDAGQNFEVVTVSAVTSGSPGSVTAVFSKSHAGATIPAQVSGSFGTGIVPPVLNAIALNGQSCASAGYTAYLGPGTGSDCYTLKLYGDINGDGNIIYVEYKCDLSTDPGFLYRNEVANAVVPGTTPTKSAVNSSMYLLNNLERNPDLSGCFTYQVQTASINGTIVPFVTDVALTLTVQTQMRDPQTNGFQKETKALLNITPRNVFYVWEATSLGEVPRNQPMPATIASLSN